MTADQLSELIRIRTEEKSQCNEAMKWARTEHHKEQIRDRLCALNAELARLRSQRSGLLDAA